MVPNSVSIIIPCFNDPLHIEQSVNSAISQVCDQKEIIIVDDGSDEKTKAVIKRLAPKVDLVITQENLGVSAARNKGIQAASGEFIIVLDSDDYFEPSFSEKALTAFTENDTIKVVTCHARWFTSETEFQIFKPLGGDISSFLFHNATLSNSMFKKEEWEKVGGYDEKMLNGFEDWEFYIRIHKDGGRTYVIPEVLFHYRRREGSKTTIANKNKYSLLKYIYTKHQELFKNDFPLFVDHLLSRIEREENEKIKNFSRIEYVVGKRLLHPLRWLRKLFNTEKI